MKPATRVLALLALLSLGTSNGSASPRCERNFLIDLIGSETSRSTGAVALPDAGTVHPEIRRLLSSTAKSYACQAFINNVAARLGLSNDIVEQRIIADAKGVAQIFSNQVDSAVCGAIALARADELAFPTASVDEHIFLERLVQAFFQSYAASLEDVGVAARALAKNHIAEYGNVPEATTRDLEVTARQFQSRLVTAYRDLARDRGWTHDQEARLSGKLKCSSALPSASGPDKAALSSYPSASAGYAAFEARLDRQFK